MAKFRKVKNPKGDEPEIPTDHILSSDERANLFEWYKITYELDQAVEFLYAYLQSVDRTDDLTAIKRVSKKQMSYTICWIAKLLHAGAQLAPDSVDFFNRNLADLIERYSNEKDVDIEIETDYPDRPTIQDHSRAKVDLFCDMLEDLFYAKETFSAYDILKKHQFPSKLTNRVGQRFESLKSEYEGALTKSDPDCVEFFEKLSKKDLSWSVNTLNQICDDCERYGSNTAKMRAPRKKKVISVDKKFKHFKFKVEDTELKAVSVRATDIVGAQEVWLYNTAVKQLTVLRALDRGGLDIQRSSITKFDPATSVTKRASRNIDTTIQNIISGGKIMLRKLMDDITSSVLEVADRSTSNTLILRVVKG